MLFISSTRELDQLNHILILFFHPFLYSLIFKVCLLGMMHVLNTTVGAESKDINNNASTLNVSKRKSKVNVYYSVSTGHSI